LVALFKGLALFAYIGSRTTRERNARGAGISVFSVNPASGTFTLVQVVKELVNPSFLAINRAGNRLYTVHGDGQEVSALGVDSQDGRVHFINRVDCGGRNPVHLALDPAQRFLLVSNHLTGTVAVIPLAADGRLKAVKQLVSCEGTPGPHRHEQPFAKPHFNVFDPTGRYVLVADKGLDRVFSFRVAGGQLTAAESPWVDSREGAGPRHLVFHPAQPWVFVVNELDSTVTTYHFDGATGALSPRQLITTLPEEFTGNSRGAEIVIDRRGRYLYASNRGHDSIAVFAIEPKTGWLNLIQVVPTLGKTPRFFTLSPDGHWLYALNEESDTVVQFTVEPATGRLSPIGQSVTCYSPVCLVFSRPRLGP
jgi:6-phosphogluconolactonase